MGTYRWAGKPCEGCGAKIKGCGKWQLCLKCSVKRSRAEKGLSGSYSAIHQWLNAEYGKANECENLGCAKAADRYEWAKLNGKPHARERKHYAKLCAMCHRLYDRKQIELVLPENIALLWMALKEKGAIQLGVVEKREL